MNAKKHDLVHLLDTTTGDVEYLQVSAIHDGSADGVTDATNPTFNIYSRLRDQNVAGDVVTVVLTGAGVTQALTLRATATNAFDVRSVKAEVINW